MALLKRLWLPDVASRAAAENVWAFHALPTELKRTNRWSPLTQLSNIRCSDLELRDTSPRGNLLFPFRNGSSFPRNQWNSSIDARLNDQMIAVPTRLPREGSYVLCSWRVTKLHVGVTYSPAADIKVGTLLVDSRWRAFKRISCWPRPSFNVPLLSSSLIAQKFERIRSARFPLYFLSFFPFHFRFSFPFVSCAVLFPLITF